jgi:hypothetical protein
MAALRRDGRSGIGAGRQVGGGWRAYDGGIVHDGSQRLLAGNPAVIGSLEPLDWKLCVPGFCRVCPVVLWRAVNSIVPDQARCLQLQTIVQTIVAGT